MRTGDLLHGPEVSGAGITIYTKLFSSLDLVILSGKITSVRNGSLTKADKAFIKEKKSSPVTGLEWPRGFQEVKVPRLHDNSTGWW